MKLTKDEVKNLERLMYLVNVVLQNNLLETVDHVVFDGADCDGYALQSDLEDALETVADISGIEIPEVEETDERASFDDIEDEDADFDEEDEDVL